MNYAHIYNCKQSVSDRCLEMLFCTHLLTSRLRYDQLNALLLWERWHCSGRVRPRASGAALETSSNWTIAKVYPKKSLGLSICIFYGKKPAKRVWKLLKSSAEVALVCVRRGSWWQGRWILWMSSSVSSRSTSSTASVSELSSLTRIQLCPRHSATLKRDPSQTMSRSEHCLNDIHRYCGI